MVGWDYVPMRYWANGVTKVTGVGLGDKVGRV